MIVIDWIRCPYCGASISEARNVSHGTATGWPGLSDVLCKCGKTYSFELFGGGGTSRRSDENAQK